MIRFLILIISLTCFAATAHGLVVEFKPAAEVAEASITLGDIASFDEDTAFSRALATQPVGQAPSPGQQITLQSGPIITHLATTIDPLTPVEWRGAASVTVSRNTLMISSSDIMGIIAAYIQENAGRLAAAKIRFLPTAQPLPFSLPTGKLSWQVIPSNPDILESSRFSVIFSIDGRVRKNMSVRGKMEILAQVVVAARDLPRGTVLEAGHLAMATLDIASQREPVLDPQEIVGKKTPQADPRRQLAVQAPGRVPSPHQKGAAGTDNP